VGGDNHSDEWCFINPRSKAYRPDVRARRVAQAKARGIKIPPELEVADAPDSNNMVANVQALVGLFGGSGEQSEALIDQILSLQ